MSAPGANYEDPRSRRDEHYRNVREFKEETRRRADALRAEIAELKAKRQELRMTASTTAGVVGLRYLAETNSYVRLVGTVDEEIVLPEVVARPEPLAPEAATPSPEATSPTTKSVTPRNERWLSVGDWVLWAFALIVGSFVGVGLTTIAGFSPKVEPWFFVPAILIGFCVVGGLKLMVSYLWRIVGHAHALGSGVAGRLALAAVLTAGGCFVDAHLGASALKVYMQGRTFGESSIPGYWQLFLLALAVTCPILLASGALYYEKGRREPSQDEREASRLERERERAERERRERLEREERERSRHREALQGKIDGDYADQQQLAQKKYDERKRLDDERAEDWADLKNNAEYKCLQGLIGQIGVLTVEITEKERDLTNYKISRGFEKSSEFPNGKKSTPPNGESEKQGPDDEGKEDGEGFAS